MPHRAAGGARTATSGDPCGFHRGTGRRPPSAAAERSPILGVLEQCQDRLMLRFSWSGDGRVNYARRQQYRRAVAGWACRSRRAAVSGRDARPLAREHGGDIDRRSFCCCSRSVSASMRGTGSCSPAAAGSAPARRTRCSERSRGSKRRAGGCATRRRGADAGTSTRSRSPPPAWPSRSRPRPRPTRTDTLLVCANRRHGYRVAGGDGASEVRCRSVPCSTSRGRACRGRSAGGVDRPACGGSPYDSRPAPSSGLPAVRSPGCPG